ncbi:arginyl-tRNA--protein transferase 1-like [Nematostella vectensis]|uniref:arginyl-tRNA--protein transferase 1-like n=1 Tax=Nematostella vectensis TaxID=45351 RepID=UPI0020778152|nr:arginyl-tRNA--protein transferase 1-like [Nematostella vectensis]
MDFHSKEEASQSQTVNEDKVPTTNDDDEDKASTTNDDDKDKASTTNDDDQDKASTTNDNEEFGEIEKNPPVEPAEYPISEDKRKDLLRQIIEEERTPSSDDDDGDYEEPDDDQPVHPSHYSVPEDEITSADEDEDDDKDEKEDEDELEEEEDWSKNKTKKKTKEKTKEKIKSKTLQRRGLFKRQYKPWSRWKTYSVPREREFPNYWQTKCCGGCLTGCGPVAWASVFGYYDRLAHISPKYHFSKELYRCHNGVWGSPKCVAPKKVTWTVRKYIEAIRKEVRTYCKKGLGATNAKGMGKIQPWYRARQGYEAYISKYWKKLSYNLGWPRPWIKHKAANAIKKGLPAVMAFHTKKKGKGRHLAVATKYKRRYRKWRRCIKVFWKWKCFKWRHTQVQDRFYMHMGWGTYKNGWWLIKTYAAFVAGKH